MSSNSLISHEPTGIDPSAIKDSLEIYGAIRTPARPIRRPAALSPATEDMPISDVNTPQRSTLARNNPYSDHFPHPGDSTDPALNNATTSGTGVTTTITGGTTATNAAAPGLFDAFKQGMKDLIQLPIDAIKLQTHHWRLKKDAGAIQKARIAENKRQRESTEKIAQKNVSNGPGNKLGEASTSATTATATTTTTNTPAASAIKKDTTMASNNTKVSGRLDADLRDKVKAAMAAKRKKNNNNNNNNKTKKKNVSFADEKDTGAKQEEPKRPRTG
ncbi:uncharacterized protein H6S33_011791 [Morchella sextelata]|uniref:uncharacterized protein n=1 Tax=Morchella sextelata TaxID=1174677 RepID=UPI001D03C4FE|nr:uncharacterized protein H6S33_011791 [Morchella sextelata]KAH0610264.1 hypothetical protein H6S33_011791 [Morchella sextelata]